MRTIPIVAILFLAGCAVPPELIEAQARLKRLEAEQAQREADLAAAQERVRELAAKLRDGGDDREVAQLQTELASAKARLTAAQAALSSTRKAAEAATKARDHWREYADKLSEAKAARYAEQGLEIGDKIAGVIPWIQGLFPGFGFLGIAAGVWETIRRRRKNG